MVRIQVYLVNIDGRLTEKYNRKIPWRMSPAQKRRQRKRLRLVDNVVDTVSSALQRNNVKPTKNLLRWQTEMPREEEMLPKDKYTMFDRKEKKYRKGVHSTFKASTSRDAVAELKEPLVKWRLHANTTRRVAKVDQNEPETQPPRFLSARCCTILHIPGV